LKSRNFVCGIILVAAGIAGLVYSMPIVSDAMSLKSRTEPAALGKAPLPSLPSYDSAILGVEIASIPALIAGIVLMALGQSKAYEADKTSTEQT
jgi:hypothetical protein